MKAMILAAGLGTRLKPITDRIPKALVEVDGVPMLERVIFRLKKEGFDKVIVNVHHFGEQIVEFIKQKDFGAEILISDERGLLLDTGGGIVMAMPLLFGENREPVLVHNVDIISNADLKGLMEKTNEAPGVRLLVSDRDSSRKLLFDEGMSLGGWHDIKNEKFRMLTDKRKDSLIELAFSGIYCMTYEGAEEMKRILGEGKFSVMEYFLNPQRKEKVRGEKQDNLELIDIGKPATLVQAHAILKNLNKSLN